MGRNRVLSFISQFSAPHRDSRTPTPTSSPADNAATGNPPPKQDSNGDLSHTPTPSLIDSREPSPVAPSPVSLAQDEYAPSPTSAVNHSNSSSPAGRSRSNSRPLSMVQTYHPPLMDVNEETLPELQPIFTFLNSHTNKLYQEGYFLKLDDQDIKGKPNPDRTWTECFAQLVGTVLSLWDAADLDAAGEDGEVLPKFINLTDASIKMIESLPTRSNDEQPLQNILSISTAGRNRYLLHFNSHHSLIQWTSGIRLAMFEHSTLQEAYTGALVAGKGKSLNNINIIMERARLPIQEWVRVRFGAGVPWRRCWCVIDPPNEKEYQKVQRDLKKRSPYDRSHPPVLKGEIRFYDTKKDAEKKKKHSRPIASIADAYSAYAIYPQSRTLIDGSTLLKVEGNITIHSDPPSSTEGFVFIMPEVPPAVSGFEMLLRFLFPTWDTFGLYGRPGRLVASVLDPRSLMFAMPKHKRYGYLEILDVSGLILTDGSSTWSEREWRRKLKELTGQRMAAVEDGSRTHSRSASRSSKRLSFGGPPTAGPTRARVNFADDTGSVRSGRSFSISKPGLRTDSAPPDPNRERAPSALAGHSRHSRHISDTQIPDALSNALEGPNAIPSAIRGAERGKTFASDLASTPERVSSDDELPARGMPGNPGNNLNEMQRMQTPEPVNPPPAFAHGAGSRPQQKPYHSPEMRRANSRLSSTTLSQLAKAGGLTPDGFPDDPMDRQHGEDDVNSSPGHTDPRGPAVQPHASANPVGMNANYNGSREVLTSPNNPNSARASPGLPPSHMALSQQRSNSPLRGYAQTSQPGTSGGPSPNFRPGPGMGPPPPPHGRGTPPMMSPRGPPPDGRGYPQEQPRDPRMGVPSPHGPPNGYASYQRGPPPSARRTPPPSQGMPHPQQSPPVHRKPLPQRTTSLQRRGDDAVSPLSPGSPGSSGAFSQQSMDRGAYGSPRPSGNTPPVLPHQPARRNSDRSAASSRYDDVSSTASPDYASTRKSTDTQESVDRPRAGVLKVIGNESAGPGLRRMNENPSEYDIPDINFGPTFNYSKGGGPLRQNESSGAHHSQRPFSPTTGRKSPGPGAGYTHFHQESDDTIHRTVPWQPGIAVGSSTGDHSVSPEQFVQQRVATAATPVYTHQRNPSANTLTEFRAGTPTSPHKRPGTSHGLSHSRHNSADLLQSGRPASQGSMAILSGGEVSSYLSAREQEHVARVTGTPLIASAGNRNPGQPQAGLIGHIQAREVEKAQMRQGIGGQAVAHAIDQRQRQQNQQAQRAAQVAYAQQAQFAAQQGHVSPQGMMSPGMMGGAPSAHGPGMVSMNARSMSPGPGMMNAGMNAPRIGSGFQQTPGYGPTAPRPQMSPQGSYTNASPTGQGYPAAGGWGGSNMANFQQRIAPLQTPPGYGPGMQGEQSQSPEFQPPLQGQHSPSVGAQGRPGTPGRMQFQRQAF